MSVPPPSDAIDKDPTTIDACEESDSQSLVQSRCDEAMNGQSLQFMPTTRIPYTSHLALDTTETGLVPPGIVVSGPNLSHGPSQQTRNHSSSSSNYVSFLDYSEDESNTSESDDDFGVDDAHYNGSKQGSDVDSERSYDFQLYPALHVHSLPNFLKSVKMSTPLPHKFNKGDKAFANVPEEGWRNVEVQDNGRQVYLREQDTKQGNYVLEYHAEWKSASGQIESGNFCPTLGNIKPCTKFVENMMKDEKITL